MREFVLTYNEDDAVDVMITVTARHIPEALDIAKEHGYLVKNFTQVIENINFAVNLDDDENEYSY